MAFRTAAAKVLPEEIAFRKKLGFIVPIRIWMADERYNQDVQRLFHSDIAEKFFDVDAINEILMNMLEEILITGEKYGQSIRSLYGMKSTL